MNEPNGLCYCGVPEELFGRRARERKWDKRDLLWAIVDYIPTIGQIEQEVAYRVAFNNWQSVCGLSFAQTTDQSEADFLILTRNIDGPSGTLAEHQLPYGSDAQLRGWFDVGDKWTTKQPHGPNVIDLVAVATHEFGHGIGLPHITAPGSLMNPFYDPAIRTPQKADIEEAQQRYGLPQLGPKPEPTPEADYPVKILMASGASYPVLKPTDPWGAG